MLGGIHYPPPLPHSMLEEVRRADQSPNQTDGDVCTLNTSKWLISNKKRIRYKLFASNISMLPIFHSSKLMVFVWQKQNIFTFSTNYLKQSSCIILLKCTY